MKKNSIFFRFFIYFIIFTLILVGTIWFSQVFFLPEYYQSKKVEIIESSVLTIDEMIQKEELSDNTLNLITDISERLNGRITIFDFQGKVVLYEGSQGMMRETRITKEEIQKLSEEKFIVYKTNAIRGSNEFLAALAQGDKYIYLVLTPYQAIEDAISIAQNFYLFILAGGILIALLLAYIFASKISKPLLELNELAGDIASLDFSGKWKYKRSDEIGQLGDSLNEVSVNLERSLKDLQNELEKEKNLDKLRKNFVSRVSHEL
ncbi:MAG: HAMP domain-containing protein, partial [Eubacteriales bacterium]|nr:HAMP domain-containing protein [Eubacteriales bacterium]